jgi:DNA-binding MarR family transcriptional regulator
MSEKVSITLSSAQVAQVVRAATRGEGLSGLLTALNDPQNLRASVLASLDSNRYSRSALRSLLVLTAFPLDGAERELTDVAKQLGMSPSTTHRYVATWVEVGMLERDPTSRKYRRPAAL